MIKRNKFIFAVIFLALTVAGYYFYKSNSTKEVSYTEFKAFKGNVEITVQSTGTVQPENRLEIKPPIAGRIDVVKVREGEIVSKGQILAWMSSTERAALLDAARSKDQAEVKKWEALYRPTPILAPLDGTLILRNIEAGQTVTNADPILVMSDRLIVKAKVDETDMAMIKLKQNATIVLDAYPTEKIKAVVDHIAFESIVVNNITTYDVDVLPNTVPDFMRAGMTANVTFQINVRNDTLLIPTEAITYTNETPSVLIQTINSDNKKIVTEQIIKLGLSDGKNTEVLEGLNEGDIILSPEQFIGDKKQSSSNPFQPNFRGRRGRKK